MPESSGSWNCKSEAGVTCDPDDFNRKPYCPVGFRSKRLDFETSFDSTSPGAVASLKRAEAE
jgi:hypothetical protein